MICAGDFQRVSEDTSGVVIIVAGGISLTPGREGFPAKGDDDLFAPIWCVRVEPFFIEAAAVGIEAKLPGTVEVEPVHALSGAALAVGPGVLWAWGKHPDTG